jgi:signal transduction histidine kinase
VATLAAGCLRPDRLGECRAFRDRQRDLAALGPATALYLLASSRDGATPWTPCGAVVVVVLVIGCLGAGVAVIGFAGSDLLHAGLACAAASFAGERTRLRGDQIADLSRRATRAEQDAARERQLAVAEERARIARDLHDSAGHALNVIAVRAGAARLRHRQDPDRSLSALSGIEQIVRETVADIDQFVGTLRRRDAAADAADMDAADGAGETVETPHGLASLATLVAKHEATGLRVTGERAGTARDLGRPPTRRRTASCRRRSPMPPGTARVRRTSGSSTAARHSTSR